MNMEDYYRYVDSPYVVLFGAAGVCLSSILSILGAAKSASAAALLSAGRGPPQPSKAGNGKANAVKGPVLPAILATLVAVLALFLGLAMSIMISRQLKPAMEGYTAFKGAMHLGAGLTMGIAALMAGRLISSAARADSGRADSAHNSREIMCGLFVSCNLILAAGFLVSLYLNTR